MWSYKESNSASCVFQGAFVRLLFALALATTRQADPTRTEEKLYENTFSDGSTQFGTGFC